jgi:hypothetical protein
MHVSRRRVVLAGLGLAVGGAGTACAERRTLVLFYASKGYRFSPDERRVIADIAERAAIDVAALLPGLPARITMRVEPGDRVIPETGEGGSAHPPDVVYWMVDPRRRESVRAIATRWLRGTMFHECCHLIRAEAAASRHRILDDVVNEGLATAFERTCGGGEAPWGDYPPDAERGWTSCPAWDPTPAATTGCIAIRTGVAGSATRPGRTSSTSHCADRGGRWSN